MNHRERILFIDAYDSFSANIIALLRHVLDVQIDDIKIDTSIPATFSCTQENFLQSYHAIVLGPGPGNPLDDSAVGLYKTVWRIAAAHQIPVLGICLGFQSLCATYGLAIERLEMPCHGHAKVIEHGADGIFDGVGEVVATCYNSLGVRLSAGKQNSSSSRPRTPDSGYESRTVSSRTSFEMDQGIGLAASKACEVTILAWDDEGWVQAVQHDTLPFCGLQFHPESCKSNSACADLIRNWWTSTSEHNDKCRSLLPIQHEQTTASPTPAPVQDLNHPILDILNQLSPPTGNGVQYLEARSSVNRAQMAQLCQQLSHSEHLYMLESSKKGRYSIYAITDSSTWTLEYAHGVLRLISDNTPCEQPTTLDDAIMMIGKFMSSSLATGGPSESPFWGGLIGYFSYELGLDLLQIDDPLSTDLPPREVPDYSLTWISRSIVVDKDTGTIYIQSLRPNDIAFLESTLTSITALTDASTPQPPLLDLSATEIDLPCHSTYTSLISQCQQHLHAGNSYELCLTTPSTIHLPHSIPPFTLHQHLLSHNPSTYSALLTLPSLTIHSLSPEQFLSWPRPTVSSLATHLLMSPMKGTLAKRPNMTREDAARELGTRKEEAENLMIVDLIRHDLTKALDGDAGAADAANSAKVEVEKLFELVEAETMWQLISCVTGTVPAAEPSLLESETRSEDETDRCLLRQRRRTLRHAMSALRATLPPGSMTGAPKKRSCEILRELERRNRGVYAGVLGYLDVGGGGAWSVAIRCAFEVKEKGKQNGGDKEGPQKLHVAAGGAITVLSDVEGEWEEMKVKVESVLKAFQ